MSLRAGSGPRAVLIVMPSLSRGGAERHSAWIATELDPSRWTAHVLAFDGGPLLAELVAAGIPVEVRQIPSGYRSVTQAARAVRETIERVRPALVSGHHIRVEVAIRVALRGAPLPYVAWKHTYGHVGHRGLRERVFERLTGGSVTRYGAVCHTQVRYLTDELGLPPDKISVVPNGVPVPRERPEPPPPGPPAVLMVAAMRRDKDHDLVLRSWPSVLARYPEARLRLAGDGPCRAELERLTSDLGITDSVDFLGQRADVDRLLADSHLLVLASYAVECFPYAVLEAMAAGRGVVATNVAGLPEMVEDGLTGRLVPPRDSGALGTALIEGLVDATADTPGWGMAGWARTGAAFPLDRWIDRIGLLFDTVAARRRNAVTLMPPKRSQ